MILKREPSQTPEQLGRRLPAHAVVSDFRLRKKGVSRYDLRDPYYTAVTLPWWAFTIAVLALVFTINTAFALLYLAQPGAVQNLGPKQFWLSLFFSIETLSTVGYGEMAPATFYGHVVSACEIVLGMAFTASLTGILFVRLSRPKARILFADAAVIHDDEGKRRLAIRVANGRQEMLINAFAVLAAFITDRDAAGQTVWRTQRLALEHETLSVFPLTWTVTHLIDEASPLQAFSPAEFAVRDVRLYLMIEADDPAISADVHDLRGYEGEAIVFDKHYAEAVSRDERGRIMADLSRLSALV